MTPVLFLIVSNTLHQHGNHCLAAFNVQIKWLFPCWSRALFLQSDFLKHTSQGAPGSAAGGEDIPDSPVGLSLIRLK